VKGPTDQRPKKLNIPLHRAAHKKSAPDFFRHAKGVRRMLARRNNQTTENSAGNGILNMSGLLA